MSSITWLHLSDLHCLSPATNWDRKEILKTILKDFFHMEEEYGLLPDLIFFTGDMAFGQTNDSSISQQFEYAGFFLEEIRTAFSKEIPKRNIFIVPGNHDINRLSVTIDQVNWLDKEANIDCICKLISSPNVQWNRYVERLREYAEFLNIWGYNHLLHDRERMVFHSIREIEGLKIGIVGFNSVWSSSRDGEKGKLWFGGQWQVQELSSMVEDANIKIALVHHPPNWFVENDDSTTQRLIERKFNFLLHGHEHMDWVESKRNTFIRVASAACYERLDSDNGYNMVKLDVSDQTCKIWLRKFDHSGGGWVARPVANHAPRGIWTIKDLTFLQKEKIKKSVKKFTPNISYDNLVSSENKSNILPSKVLLKQNEFEILKELGRGSFGVVYLVENKKTNLQHALKLFTPETFEQDDRNEAYLRFRRGIQIMKGLGHPGVLHIFNVVDEGPQKCYYLMDYCKLGNLKKFCEKSTATSTLLTIKEKLDMVLSLCGIVTYSHKKKIIHRDIKPNNILLDWDEEAQKIFPKLVDFDLAFQKGNTGLTYGNMGSIFFLPPEIHKDLSQQAISPLTSSLPSLKLRAECIDIYATAGILYYIFTLCYPPLGNDDLIVSEFNRVLETVKDKRDKEIVKAIGYIVYQSLNSDTSKRPETVDQLRELIETSFAYPESFKDNYEKLFSDSVSTTNLRNKETSSLKKLSYFAIDILFDRIKSAVLILEEGFIRFLNNSASLLIQKSESEVLGRHLDIFIKVLDDEDIYRGITDYIYTFTQSNKTLNMKLPNDVVKSCDVAAANFSYKNKENLLLIIDDRTKTDELERGLRRAQKMEALGTLAGGVAHDFNNILAGILGYAELLKMENKEQIEKNYIDGILSAANRAKDLVSQLLSFSRQKETELKPIKISAILIEVMKLIKASIPSNIKLIQNIRYNEGLVQADANQMHQVFMNIIVNAYHAIGDVNGTISVTLEKAITNIKLSNEKSDIKNQSYIKISVKDDGSGIDKENFKHIFDPFFTTKSPNKGTGLGLSVCKGIIETHGGDIQVESEIGKGSKFNVFLPEYISAEAEYNLKFALKGDGEKIIFVDDEKELVAIYKDMLGKNGYSVSGFTSPLEAYNEFLRNPSDYDILITDMTMPEMTGDVLSNKFKKIRPDIPIILCSGYSPILDRVDLITNDVFYKIMKPIPMNRLMSIIAKALNKVIKQQ